MAEHADPRHRSAAPASAHAASTAETEAAVAAADRATVLRHRALGIPLLVWQNGRMVEVDPWTVALPEVPPGGPAPPDGTGAR